jgi:hypothetical protein
VKNCGGGPISPVAVSGSNPACSRAEAAASELGDDPRLETVPLQWPLAVMTQRSSRSSAMQDTQRGRASGRGARGSTAPWGLGLGFPGVRVPLFVGRRGGLGVRARRESLTGDLGWPVCVGEERKKGEDEALAGGAKEPQRERGIRGARCWAAGGKGERGGEARGREGEWAGVAHVERRGVRERKKWAAG